MATRKPAPASKTSPAKPTPHLSAPDKADAAEAIGTVLSTVSGPSSAKLDDAGADALPTEAQQRLAHKQVGAQGIGEGMPFNALKAGEYGHDAGHAPQHGKISVPH